jgi:catechol 2,3-dioxygenase-like lactoylglutathione lyase family enzyme
MKYESTLIAVSDMERSKAFYKKYLGQEVVVDFGVNVTLTCGIALQTLESWRDFIDGLPVIFKNNASELYFEEDDFDGFLAKLDGVELVHPPKEHAWGQRVVRLYDPDSHIIEIGENMSAVARRFLNTGITVEAIATRMDVQVQYVRDLLAESKE